MDYAYYGGKRRISCRGEPNRHGGVIGVVLVVVQANIVSFIVGDVDTNVIGASAIGSNVVAG